MKRKILISIGILFLIGAFFYLRPNQTKLINPRPKTNLWQIRSIDTVKYSRDLSREKMNDTSFDLTIDTQVNNIAKTGANFVAVGTPYDQEFVPFLVRWVKSARKNNLKVWFRGNFSGWEGWFDYPKIDQLAHLKSTEDFILNNQDLFEDGDIFTSCSECENGGPGDPRVTGDVVGYRQFLIREYETSKKAFDKIHKKVTPGFFSMNGNVAKLIMDEPTTKALGEVLVIDHYVATPEKLVSDIEDLIRTSDGKLVLGEFGVPILDITGPMTETEQADWLKRLLTQLSYQSDVIGLNYWVNVGGSTQVWDENNQPKKAVEVLKEFYSAKR